jgi:hypothetical protein
VHAALVVCIAMSGLLTMSRQPRQKYLAESEVFPGALFMSPSYYCDRMIPALIVKLELHSGALYARAIDSDGESFVSNAEFLVRPQ